jgi:hypothetical protein
MMSVVVFVFSCDSELKKNIFRSSIHFDIFIAYNFWELNVLILSNEFGVVSVRVIFNLCDVCNKDNHAPITYQYYYGSLIWQFLRSYCSFWIFHQPLVHRTPPTSSMWIPQNFVCLLITIWRFTYNYNSFMGPFVKALLLLLMQKYFTKKNFEGDICFCLKNNF